MEINLEKVRQNQVELLSQSKTLLKECYISKFKEPLCFSCNELNKTSKEILTSKISAYSKGIISNLIYVITLDKKQPTNKIQEAFKSYKLKKEHSLSKINISENNWNESSSVLYVGCSKSSNFKTRMKNHMGIGSKSVYSLHLIHWLPVNLKLGIRIQLYTIESPDHNSSNINLIELMEQGFWDELKPMFGKRSGLL